MLKQVTVPKDQDPNGWERLFAFYVSQEMARSSATPAQAADQAEARLRAAFGAQFPGEDLPIEISDPEPSSSEEPLAGGLRTEDGKVWFILARVEDERSMFDEADRITADLLGSMTRAYDSDFRRAALVGPNGGPAHTTGEWSRFIPGHVQALEFDGYYLWGLVEERFAGGLEFLVEDGHTQRSISWWPSLPELEGEPPYLRHVAMLTGEPPGIANMPGLEQWFLADEGVAQEELRQIAALPTLERSLGELPTIERSMTMGKQKTDTKPANPDGTRSDEGIDLEDFGRSIAAAVAAELKGSNPEPKPQPEPKAKAEELEAALTRALKPLHDEFTAFKEAQKTAATERRNARIAERLDQFVRDGKLSPVDRRDWERILTKGHLSEDEVEAELEALSKRSKVSLLGGGAQFVTVDETEVRVPPHLRTPPGEAPVDPSTMKVLLKAREAAAKESDPQKAYQIRRRMIYEGLGEELAVN